jgi:hypothetical protein
VPEHNNAKEPQRLLIYLGIATVDITGPKAAVFHEDFTNHRATLLKADGKEILSA